MQLFYHPSINNDRDQVVFDRDESRHIYKVLRKTEGDLLNITNGRGLLAEVRLDSVGPKSCRGMIIGSIEELPISYRLHMAVAPTKSMDRFEWFIEKATEIGISEITPVICAQSERKIVKLERLERIAVAAMKQSLRSWLPQINPAVKLDEFLSDNHAEEIKAVAHCVDGPRVALSELITATKDCLILIGPEGDFNEDEIALAISQGFKPVSLGKNRLRTETAALVACHSIAFINDQ